LEGHVACMKEMRNKYNIFVGKPEGKKQLGRCMRRWEDNIRMDLSEGEWKVVDWIHLSQDRNQWWVLVNKVINLRVP